MNRNGEFEVFSSTHENGELTCECSYEDNFHEQKIIMMDFLPSKKIILTSANDNKVFLNVLNNVKLWHIGKILLAQINVSDNLSGAFFSSDEGDVIVSHDGKLSLIRESHFNISLTQIENINSIINTSENRIMNMDQFYNTLKHQQMMNVQKGIGRFKRIVNFTENDTRTSQFLTCTGLISEKATQEQVGRTHKNVQGMNHIINQQNNLQGFVKKAKSSRNSSISLEKTSEQAISSGNRKSLTQSANYDVPLIQNPQKKENSLTINKRKQSGSDSNIVPDRDPHQVAIFSEKNYKTITQESTKGNKSMNQSFEVQHSLPDQSLTSKKKVQKPITFIEQQYNQQMQLQSVQTSIQKEMQIQKLIAYAHLKGNTSQKLENSLIYGYKKITALPLANKQFTRPQTLFMKFAKDKLQSNKVQTRRDITLNKIIMKNLIATSQVTQAIMDQPILQGLRIGYNYNVNK